MLELMKRDYSQAFELTARQEAAQRYNRKHRKRIQQKAKERAAHPERKQQLKLYQSQARLKKSPLQERSWWAGLSKEHQQLFLAEFDPAVQTVNSFKAYLKLLPKNPEMNTCRVLTPDQVIDIRTAFEEGITGFNHNRIGGYLAVKYGVSRQAINQVKQRRTYRNVG